LRYAGAESGDETIHDEFTEAAAAREPWLNTPPDSEGTPFAADLRGPNIFSPGKLGDLIRGRRPDR
jgi:hypothetical protein